MGQWLSLQRPGITGITQLAKWRLRWLPSDGMTVWMLECFPRQGGAATSRGSFELVRGILVGAVCLSLGVSPADVCRPTSYSTFSGRGAAAHSISPLPLASAKDKRAPTFSAMHAISAPALMANWRDKSRDIFLADGPRPPVTSQPKGRKDQPADSQDGLLWAVFLASASAAADTGR